MVVEVFLTLLNYVLTIGSDQESVDTTDGNVEDNEISKVYTSYLEKKFDGEPEELVEYQKERANENASIFIVVFD